MKGRIMSQAEVDGPRVENYVVACVDVLGQRERLKAFPPLILNPRAEDVERASEAIESTYRRVLVVRDLIRGYLKKQDTLATDTDWYQSLSAEDRAEFHRLRDYRIESQQFSDTVVFHAPLGNSSGMLTLTPIVHMLWASAMTMLASLSERTAIRGAIEIGAALSDREFGIYGSAYYGAYDLESKVAGYPRIVIGPRLFEYLRKWEENEGTDRLGKLNGTFVEWSKRMMCEDADGRPIVDFLSEDLSRLFGHDSDESTSGYLKTQRERGFAFVTEELERFKREAKSDLAFRYAHLLDYFAARVGVSQIAPDVLASVERFLAVVRERLRIEAAYLYGSQVLGLARAWSDIDIAVVSSDFSDDLFEERVALMRCAGAIDDRIEPQPFTPERFGPNDPLASEISRHGVRLL